MRDSERGSEARLRMAPPGRQVGRPIHRSSACSPIFQESQPVFMLLQATVLKWAEAVNLWLAPGGSVSIPLRKRVSISFFSHKADHLETYSPLSRGQKSRQNYHKLRGIKSDWI